MEKFFKSGRIWRTIGTDWELGVDVDTLSAIEKDHADDNDHLHAVIDSANPNTRGNYQDSSVGKYQ